MDYYVRVVVGERHQLLCLQHHSQDQGGDQISSQGRKEEMNTPCIRFQSHLKAIVEAESGF